MLNSVCLKILFFSFKLDVHCLLLFFSIKFHVHSLLQSTLELINFTRPLKIFCPCRVRSLIYDVMSGHVRRNRPIIRFVAYESIFLLSMVCFCILCKFLVIMDV